MTWIVDDCVAEDGEDCISMRLCRSTVRKASGFPARLISYQVSRLRLEERRRSLKLNSLYPLPVSHRLTALVAAEPLNSLVLTRRSGSRMKSIVSLAHVHVGDVRVDLRRRNVAMAQQRLH